MKFSGLIFLWILFSTVCYSQQPKLTLDDFNLKGKVKSLKQTAYRLKENFGEPVKDKPYHFTEWHLLEFDTTGKILKKTIIGHRVDNLVTYIYEYDEGIISKYIATTHNGDLFEKAVFNEDGNITEKNIYGSYFNGSLDKKYSKNNESGLESKVKYKYNQDGLIDVLFEYDHDGTLSNKTEYKYIVGGHIGVKTSKNIKYGWEDISSYEYNESGWMTHEEIYKDGTITGKRSFEYDKYGNIAKTIFLINGSDLKSNYKYDQHGNWIEDVRYSGDSPSTITIREIEYYQP